MEVTIYLIIKSVVSNQKISFTLNSDKTIPSANYDGTKLIDELIQDIINRYYDIDFRCLDIHGVVTNFDKDVVNVVFTTMIPYIIEPHNGQRFNLEDIDEKKNQELFYQATFK